MVMIRLKRAGVRRNPFYRVTVADSRRAVSGKFIENIGSYNPFKKDSFVVKKDRYEYWLGQGAQPTLRVKNLYKKVQ